jgi:hypothetical protein
MNASHNKFEEIKQDDDWMKLDAFLLSPEEPQQKPVC